MANNHFSAEVRIELVVDGVAHELAGVGPTFFVSRHPIDIPACDAEIRMTVDGDAFVWPVRLPYGSIPGRRDTDITVRGEMRKR